MHIEARIQLRQIVLDAKTCAVRVGVRDRSPYVVVKWARIATTIIYSTVLVVAHAALLVIVWRVSSVYLVLWKCFSPRKYDLMTAKRLVREAIVPHLFFAGDL